MNKGRRLLYEARMSSVRAVMAVAGQRCVNDPGQARPAYWDVTYNFIRGQDHRVQMTSAPGDTISVNVKGEPRS